MACHVDAATAAAYQSGLLPGFHLSAGGLEADAATPQQHMSAEVAAVAANAQLQATLSALRAQSSLGQLDASTQHFLQQQQQTAALTQQLCDLQSLHSLPSTPAFGGGGVGVGGAGNVLRLGPGGVPMRQRRHSYHPGAGQAQQLQLQQLLLLQQQQQQEQQLRVLQLQRQRRMSAEVPHATAYANMLQAHQVQQQHQQQQVQQQQQQQVQHQQQQQQQQAGAPPPPPPPPTAVQQAGGAQAQGLMGPPVAPLLAASQHAARTRRHSWCPPSANTAALMNALLATSSPMPLPGGVRGGPPVRTGSLNGMHSFMSTRTSLASSQPNSPRGLTPLFEGVPVSAPAGHLPSLQYGVGSLDAGTTTPQLLQAFEQLSMAQGALGAADMLGGDAAVQAALEQHLAAEAAANEAAAAAAAGWGQPPEGAQPEELQSLIASLEAQQQAAAAAGADQHLLMQQLPGGSSPMEAWGYLGGGGAAGSGAGAGAGAAANGGHHALKTVSSHDPQAGTYSPSNKLFVGNIGWWVTEEHLASWFGRFGNVTHVKIMYNSRKMHKPKDKWRSREYGFVDFAAVEEAAAAVAGMGGLEVPELCKDSSGIIVQFAKPTAV